MLLNIVLFRHPKKNQTQCSAMSDHGVKSKNGHGWKKHKVILQKKYNRENIKDLASLNRKE